MTSDELQGVQLVAQLVKAALHVQQPLQELLPDRETLSKVPQTVHRRYEWQIILAQALKLHLS